MRPNGAVHGQSGVVQRAGAEPLGTLIAKPPGEGGEILSPEDSARFRRERRLEEVDARRRAAEADTRGTLIAQDPTAGGQILSPEDSSRFRRERRLEAVDARTRAAETRTLDTLIAQGPDAGGRILPPEARGKRTERAGKVAPPTPASQERDRLEKIAAWELQVKAQPIFEAARTLGEQAGLSNVHKPPRLPGLLASVKELWAAGKYGEVIADGPALQLLAQQVVDADRMLASIHERYAELPPSTDQKFGVYRKNMDTWLAAHAAKPWEQQIHSDGLPKINNKMIEYVSTIAGRRETEARGEAAVVRARQEGRIAADGTIIDRKEIATFATQEERQAITDALGALAGGQRDWPGKWGEDHGNHEGRLPGIPGAGNYREYYVRKGPQHAAPGPRRFCVNRSGKVFYSNTHYGTSGRPAFWAIRGW